ncbi:hypothetical protein QFZ20_003910 [Flavobacterium sp. W4I14]|nr:hypothetical protein [Flavobacterium sp. W4I14]
MSEIENSISGVAKKKNFDFVDTIRCISMIGIVFEHCAIVGDPKTSNLYLGMLHVSVMQFFKFATIAFFFNCRFFDQS